METLYRQLYKFCDEFKNGGFYDEAKILEGFLKQYVYRYVPFFGCWDDKIDKVGRSEKDMLSEIDFIEDVLSDGNNDKKHDDRIFRYHETGRPRKLAIKWHVKKSEYMAYFWFEDVEIRTVFDCFYGPHPDTKADFMIRIDTDNNKYQLSLYHYGLSEPRIISESAYQLIVFKNKFEYYRSDNYNQPSGAWIW